jgi:hypothetical protein
MVLNLSNYKNMREIFCDSVTKVFGSSDTFFDILESGKYVHNFDYILRSDDDNYIINITTGEYITWYKTYHLGRYVNISVANVEEFNKIGINKWFENFLTDFRDGVEE